MGDAQLNIIAWRKGLGEGGGMGGGRLGGAEWGEPGVLLVNAGLGGGNGGQESQGGGESEFEHLEVVAR